MIGAILRHDIESFTNYQIQFTSSSSLADAHAKLSIEAPLVPFQDALLRRLEAEKDELTPLELMVVKI